MKAIINILLISILLFLNSCSNINNSIEPRFLLGKSVESKEVSRFLKDFEFEIFEDDFQQVSFYTSVNDGIELVVDKNKKLIQMEFFSARSHEIMPYYGELPYDLTFLDTRETIHNKLGKPTKTFDRYYNYHDNHYGSLDWWEDLGLNIAYCCEFSNEPFAIIMSIKIYEIK